MSGYQALYRKYRPKSFADVIGQEHITQVLLTQSRTGRLSHAYLFSGSRGTGKTTCAKILAKAANCLELQDGDPCNRCERCLSAESGADMDILEIDAASNNGVENIRDLREQAVFSPTAGKCRVYIIDEAHMLSQGAANALLKTLEEPPAHVIFILATTEPHKLPATILSRCQRFEFRRIDPETIAKRLLWIAGEENLILTGDAALLIARLSDGGMRDALSLLDLCAGRAGQINENTVAEAAGLAGRESLFTLSKAVVANDTAAALQEIDRLHSSSKDLLRLCEELLSHYRDLSVARTARTPEKLLVCAAAELSELKNLAGQYTLTRLLDCMSLLEAALERMPRTDCRRVELELALVRMCAPAADGSPEALAQRVEALEEEVRKLKRNSEFMEQSAPPREETSPFGAAPEANSPDGKWRQIQDEAGAGSRLLFSLLKGSSAQIRGNRLVISSENAGLKDFLKRDERLSCLLSDVAERVLGAPHLISFDGDGADAAPAADKVDPLAVLQTKLSGIFGGDSAEIQ